MKKISRTLAVIMFFILMATNISAFALNAAFNQSENIMVVFENDCNLTDVQKQIIAEDVLEYHLNGTVAESIAPCGLLCTLFGHNEEINTVYTIEHKVSVTSPRCLRTTYNVTTCTRCDYENIEFVMEQGITT